MLKLLFDMNVVYDLLILLFIFALIIFALKNPKVGWPIFGTIATVAVLGVTLYCGINLNYYYSASGGIFGYLSGQLPTNVVEVDDDNFEFKFKNVELLQGDDGRYSATVVLDQVMTLEGEINVFVNEMPCQVVDYGSTFLSADFSYIFYNQDMNVTSADTLSFRFSFFKNYTRITVFTEGDSTAVKNWVDFLNANDLVVRIEQSDPFIDNEIDFVDGDVSNFVKITYLVGNEDHFVTYQKIGSTFDLPASPSIPNATFVGWKLAGTNVTESSVVSGASIVVAEFQYEKGENWSGQADTTWYNSTASTFTLNTAEQLAGLAELVNSGVDNFRGKTIKLGADIYLNETVLDSNGELKPGSFNNFVGIGSSAANNFLGSIDGQNHTIYGLYQVNNGGISRGGLIGYSSNLVVKNLVIDSAYITGSSWSGIVVGFNRGTLTIDNVNVTGAIDGGSILGGFVGYNQNGNVTVTSFSFGGVINSTSGQAGGVAGHIDSGDLTVDDLSVYLKTTGSADCVSGTIGTFNGTNVSISNFDIDLRCATIFDQESYALQHNLAFGVAGIIMVLPTSSAFNDNFLVDHGSIQLAKSFNEAWFDYYCYFYFPVDLTDPDSAVAFLETYLGDDIETIDGGVV